LQQVKDLFDPHNLMNPGKIISDDPHATIRNLRPPAQPTGELVPLQLKWSHRDIGSVITSCNGCGNCRTQDPQLRMCPFFRIEPDEATSPRSKANVARFVLDGRFDETHLASPEMKHLADFCFNCQQCRLECPSNVDIPGLVLEARSQYVAANGLSRSDWILSRAHSFGALGSTFSAPANWMLGNRAGRWLLEKLLGIHRRRKLPRFARKTFLATTGHARPRSTPDLIEQRPLVYFVDHYVNYHDPELGHAFVEILRQNGIDVYVPPGQTASGMAMVCAGDLDAARKLAERNVRELSESAREGLDIVCTEPAAALCLKQEYPRIIEHPDVQTVADRVQGAGDYLLALHRAGRLDTGFGRLDLDLAYHTPCHVKALSGRSPLLELLGLIPGLRLHRIELGCSGMAGAFGLTARNFETSLRIGTPLIERMQAGDVRAGTTECSSCKIQMEQGTTHPTVHPLKLLALAYGLMPELKKRLNPNTRKLLVT
jgi:Fe-S oxidoreductase